MGKFHEREIIERFRELRERYAGVRGKREFAQALGVSPSTYCNYERDRVAPVELLWRACQLTGADLEWLVSGESQWAGGGSGESGLVAADGGGGDCGGRAGNTTHGVQNSEGRCGMGERVARLCGDARSRAALEAFVSVLEVGARCAAGRGGGEGIGDAPAAIAEKAQAGNSKLETENGKPQCKTENGAEEGARSKGAGRGRRVRQVVGSEAASPGKAQRASKKSADGGVRGGWLPVLGRTAAGLVHFWGGEQGRLPAVTELTELMARHAGERHRAVGASAAAAGAGGPAAEAAQEQQGPVSLVQLSEPSADGVAEFIDAPALAARYPDAFALRVDGDSMAPRVADGDLVVVSPSRRAWNGETAVVKLVGQIGATCKIYWRLGGEVHLIAANERYETGVCAGEAVQWALAVLCRVRVG